MKQKIEEYILNCKYKEALEGIKKLEQIEDYLLSMFFKQKIEPEEQIVKEIEMLVLNKEYKGTYFEIGKYYAEKNQYKAIEYIEKFLKLSTFGIDKEQKFLLVKLYRQVGKIEQAYELLMEIGCDNEQKIEEMTHIVLSKKIRLNEVKAGIKLIMDSQYGLEKEKILKEIIYRIENTEEVINDEVTEWIAFIKENLIILSISEQVELLFSIALYYKRTGRIIKALEIFKELLIKDCNKEGIAFSEVMSILQQNKIIKKDINLVANLLKELSKICKDLKIKNVFLNEAEILEEKTELESRPRNLSILVTMKCNLKCIMCCNGHGEEYELDDEVYSYIVKNLPYLEKIEWKGGEVFLYKKFFKLVELANKYNVFQTIITNSLLLDKEKIDFLVENNVNLTISIDVVNKQLYEKVRVGGKFEKLIEVLNILKDLKKSGKKVKYCMNTVLMSLNFNMISDIIDFAIKYDFDHLKFLKCNNYPQDDKSLLLTDKQIYEIYIQLNKKIKEIPENFKIITDMPFFLDVKNDIEDEKLNKNKAKCTMKEQEDTNDYYEKVFCLKPWQLLVIDINSFSFGSQCSSLDFSKYSLSKDDIWNCKEIVSYRKNIVEKKEKACKIFLENNYK